MMVIGGSPDPLIGKGHKTKQLRTKLAQDFAPVQESGSHQSTVWKRFHSFESAHRFADAAAKESTGSG
jgi:hypothetical protein